MNRNRLPLLCSLVLLGALTPECAEAQSLFAKRPKGTPDPYSDRTAHRSGDLITILVREKQKVSQDGSTSEKESGSFGAAIEAFGLNPSTFAGTVLPDIKGSSEKEYSGDAKVSRSGQADARITVRVNSIQPNGNLVVVGRREIWVDNDKRLLTFQGVVRPDDIDSKNVVQSERVADVRLNFQGEGPAREATTRGLLSRIIHTILDFIWPF